MIMKFIQKYYEKKGKGVFVLLYTKLFLRNSAQKIKWLNLCGMKIGEGSHINCNLNAFPEPYMIELGNNVYVAGNVQFLTHDGSLSWLTRKMGLTDKRTEKIGRITIGDNCFIGTRAMIIQDVSIGKNCIIGAGAIVTKNVPDNSIVAGCPAKIICSTEEFLEKNKSRCDYTCGWSIYDKRRYYDEKYLKKDLKE